MPVDYANDVILVTCASGKQASLLLPFLSKKWKHLRLAVHSPESQDRLTKEYPDAEVLQANLAEPEECKQLLQNVTAVYHIGPTFHPHEPGMRYNMIDAAVAAGQSFKHFVYSSVINTQLRKLLNHDSKRYVEEYLMESGLKYTILNPSTFTDLFPLQQVLDSGVAMCLWNPDTQFSHTCLYDYAEMSARVLEERETHYLAQHQAISTAPLSWRDRCEALSRMIGKEVKVEMKPVDHTLGRETEKFFRLPSHPATRDVAQRLILYYNHRGIYGSPNVMKWVLGREPMSWEEWVQAKMAELDGKGFDFAGVRKDERP